MAKRRVGKYPKEFRRMAVERSKTCDSIVELWNCHRNLLFVRGPISSRRGSALAGIACGLPIIALERSETGPPVAGAGVVPVPQDDLMR